MNIRYSLSKITNIVNDFFGLEDNGDKTLYYSVYGLGIFIAAFMYLV